MPYAKASPRGARLPLLLLALALAAGAGLVVRLHLGRAVAAPRTVRGAVASPSPGHAGSTR
jgi:hypothetical protein